MAKTREIITYKATVTREVYSISLYGCPHTFINANNIKIVLPNKRMIPLVLSCKIFTPDHFYKTLII